MPFFFLSDIYSAIAFKDSCFLYVPGQNTRHMKTWFAKGGTEVLKWPAQSLDPNPTKQIWKELQI